MSTLHRSFSFEDYILRSISPHCVTFLSQGKRGASCWSLMNILNDFVWRYLLGLLIAETSFSPFGAFYKTWASVGFFFWVFLWVTGNKSVVIMKYNIEMIWHVPVYFLEQRRVDEWRGRSLDRRQCCRQSKQRPNYPNGEAGLSQVGPLILTKNSVQLAPGFLFFCFVDWHRKSFSLLTAPQCMIQWGDYCFQTPTVTIIEPFICVYLTWGVSIRVEVRLVYLILLIQSRVEWPTKRWSYDLRGGVCVY